MIIFGGVDGTGVWNDPEYKQTFRYSFVKTLWRNWSYGPRHYERGPVTIDNALHHSTFASAYATYLHVTSNWVVGESAVFLAGYSRGAAAVIEVAKWLESAYIPVECLILYDPVDRTGGVGLPWQDTPIASTVKTVIFAKRSVWSSSRENTMGNCGLVMWNGEPTPYKIFPGTTHGGMGGVPWPKPPDKQWGDFIDEGGIDGLTHVSYAQDRIGSAEVQQWSFDLIENALSECKERLSKADGPAKQPRTNPVTRGQRIHIVKEGDWLSKLAITYYGDMNKWPIIYDHNRETIGNKPDVLTPGQKLIIP